MSIAESSPGEMSSPDVSESEVSPGELSSSARLSVLLLLSVCEALSWPEDWLSAWQPVRTTPAISRARNRGVSFFIEIILSVSNCSPAITLAIFSSTNPGSDSLLAYDTIRPARLQLTDRCLPRKRTLRPKCISLNISVSWLVG